MAQTPNNINTHHHPLTVPSLLIRFYEFLSSLLLVVLLYLPILMSVASKPSKKKQKTNPKNRNQKL